jgi:hypothetical protein
MNALIESLVQLYSFVMTIGLVLVVAFIDPAKEVKEKKYEQGLQNISHC